MQMHPGRRNRSRTEHSRVRDPAGSVTNADRISNRHAGRKRKQEQIGTNDQVKPRIEKAVQRK